MIQTLPWSVDIGVGSAVLLIQEGSHQLIRKSRNTWLDSDSPAHRAVIQTSRHVTWATWVWII